ncbi:epoxide hydrolase 1 [Biomphalaria glabrata]|uniref:Epoxide hydrolase 1-like n=1 Tax=Biomphalaria glabrata TaxID=6526 RepID=A0A9U8E1A1_BIOGL|nr:epoxide hydrolase 1-like [Biomphalaria glabrata]KAI8729816.1 epoxide hydrolase 1-like [Biomphalaria glabrata]KAI8771553.1 epoxide hydrolase 1 [Biomphalaria glabrata]
MSKLAVQCSMWMMAVYHGFRMLAFIATMCWTYGVRSVFSWKPTPRPKQLDDPSLGTHGMLTLDNVVIHYVVSGPEDKPLMLFVHGFPEFWYSWRHQIREFQKDFRVVAIDMRGYGESSKPKGMDEYCLKKLLGDVKQVIFGMGYSKCILVGHDWGGAVCWAFGRLFPEMVEKLIIMNAPPAPVMQKVFRKSKKQLQMSWYIFFFQLPYLPELLVRLNSFVFFDNVFGNKYIGRLGFPKAFENPLSQEDIAAYKYTFSDVEGVTAPINYYRARLRSAVGQVDYDMAFAIPVLVVWGVKDVALSLTIVEDIEKEFPNITVRRIEDAGHFVQMDRPDLVNKAIRDWLNE